MAHTPSVLSREAHSVTCVSCDAVLGIHTLSILKRVLPLLFTTRTTEMLSRSQRALCVRMGTLTLVT